MDTIPFFYSTSSSSISFYIVWVNSLLRCWTPSCVCTMCTFFLWWFGSWKFFLCCDIEGLWNSYLHFIRLMYHAWHSVYINLNDVVLVLSELAMPSGEKLVASLKYPDILYKPGVSHNQQCLIQDTSLIMVSFHRSTVLKPQSLQTMSRQRSPHYMK